MSVVYRDGYIPEVLPWEGKDNCSHQDSGWCNRQERFSDPNHCPHYLPTQDENGLMDGEGGCEQAL